jgi:Flp pilus assembly protein CpaB
LEQGNSEGKRRRRAWTSRFSTGHVVMVVSGLLGALLTLTALHAADHTTPILAAARDLPSGTVIDAQAVRVARVHTDAATMATLIDSDQLDAIRGRVAIEDIPAGTLLTHAVLRSASEGHASRAMSFPIPKSRAVGGALGPGDRVDVLAVQRTSGRSGYVASNVEVLEFRTQDSGPLQESDDASVTIAVDAAAAARIASAIETGTLTLVRATGAAPLDSEAPHE